MEDKENQYTIWSTYFVNLLCSDKKAEEKNQFFEIDEDVDVDGSLKGFPTSFERFLFFIHFFQTLFGAVRV